LIGDVTDQVAVQSAMQGVDAVVHMAALLHINSAKELLLKMEGPFCAGCANGSFQGTLQQFQADICRVE